MSNDDMTKLKTLCQYLSKSVCKTPFLLSNIDRQHLPLCPAHQKSSLRTHCVLHVECFCVDIKHKNREILRDIVFTCILVKVLEHCVSWRHQNCKSSWDNVEKLGHRVQKMVPIEHFSCDTKR